MTLTSNPTVNGFGNVIDFVTKRLESKDNDLYSDCCNEVFSKLKSGKSGTGQNPPPITTYLELKLLINILFDKANEMLLATKNVMELMLISCIQIILCSVIKKDII